MSDHRVSALEAAFAGLIATEDVDVVTEGDDLEVQADAWTLVFTGNQAFIALDDLTQTDDEHRAALTAALPVPHLEALRDTDVRLEGGLADALTASRDPLSAVLATLLRPHA